MNKDDVDLGYLIRNLPATISAILCILVFGYIAFIILGILFGIHK